MADQPKYHWQQSRGECLYIEDATNKILGFVMWSDDNRLKIYAHGVNTKAGKEFAPLGAFSIESAAKAAVEENTAKVFPPPVDLVDENAKHVARGLAAGLEKGLVQK